MSKEMNKTFKIMIKYDLIGGIIITIILWCLINYKIAFIFLLGLLVSLLNGIISGIILEYSLTKNKSIILSLSYFLRISLILIVSLPFIKNLNTIISYILGYTSHFGFLLIYWIKNWKEGI